MQNQTRKNTEPRTSRARRVHPLFSVALLLICLVGSCWGDINGYCAVGCIANGINSRTSQNPPTNFGFTVSPQSSASGNLLLALLVPDDEAHLASYAVTGTVAGTLNFFSATPWTSGDLETYLGISASPSNPIGDYLPSTQALDPTATGFLVFDVNLGGVTLNGPGMANISPLENLPYLPLASYLVGYLDEGAGHVIATADIGAIFETTPGSGTGKGGGGPLPSVPEPFSVALLGTVAVLTAKGIARKSRAN